MNINQQSSGVRLLESDQAVADYLRQHPEFFERHIYLLKSLRVPHPTGNAVSLIERQVEALREENGRLNQRLGEIIAVARENDQLRGRMQQLTLELVAARDLTNLLEALEENLRENFQADFVIVRIIIDADAGSLSLQETVSSDDPGLGAFKNFFAGRRPLCGRLRSDQLQYLFGAGGSEVGSAALVPFDNVEVHGMIAIGSRDKNRFQASMGTVFLSYLGELVGRAFRPEYLAAHP